MLGVEFAFGDDAPIRSAWQRQQHRGETLDHV
jgi:hypothetical protein